jgi:hypothetical protein
MGQYGQRPPQKPLPRSVYWQRRVIAFILGGTVLSLLALLVNGMLSSGAASGQAAGTPSAHAAARSLPHSGRTTRAGRKARAGPTGQARPPTPARSSSPGSPPAGHSGRPACAARNVVLSLFTSRYWYQRGQDPRFAVDAVSVARRPCSFDMGARSVSVVVTWGQTRIWGSADCVQGTGSRVVTLVRGVPALLHVTWNRRTSAHGCPGARRQAHLGTYTVTAYSGQLHSNTLVVVLAGPGVGAP